MEPWGTPEVTLSWLLNAVNRILPINNYNSKLRLFDIPYPPSLIFCKSQIKVILKKLLLKN